MSAWWPPGHIIGYEHSFTHQMRDLIEAIADGGDPHPSFEDALGVQLCSTPCSAPTRRVAWTRWRSPRVPVAA